MREWPAPERSWILAQTWRDLLFAHWPVSVEEMRRAVPAPFELDLWNGEAYIGVVPFRMDGIYPRRAFPLPWLSATPEINVRTYVTYGGKRGVFFFSLDASNIVAIKIARRFFHLPYVHAAMSVSNEGEKVHYSTKRNDATFQATYGPTGEVTPAQAGTLEYWLTERYCFYTLDNHGRVIRGNIDHPPWPLQPAQVSIEANSMTAPLGIQLPDTPPLLQFARKIDVILWMPEHV